MKICKYGITLSLCRPADIEFINEKIIELDALVTETPFLIPVLQNLKEIAEKMSTPEHLYFVIEYKGDKIGIISHTGLNWKEYTSGTESIIWDASYNTAPIPALAMLCLLENCFYYLNWNAVTTESTEQQYSETLKNLGFIANKQNGGNNFTVTRESFEKEGAHFRDEARKYIDAQSGDGYLLLEADDYKTGIAQHIENHFLASDIYLYRRGIKGDRMYFRQA